MNKYEVQYKNMDNKWINSGFYNKKLALAKQWNLLPLKSRILIWERTGEVLKCK